MIRRAILGDFPRISTVRNSVRENQLDPSKVSMVADISRWIYDNGTFWVWEEDGAVQGFAAADPRDGSIFGLFVHPDYEARGIGRALLPLACADLKAAGHASAELTTQAASRAERFYRTDGWQESGRLADGQIIFRKPL
jgi:GNAT superfamily N-acetyltransferase